MTATTALPAAGPAAPGRAAVHGMALRAPWYVCERGTFDRFDPLAQAPTIQKYATDDFVAQLTRDPSDSLAFDPVEDVWTFAVPRGENDKPTTLRGLLSPYTTVRSTVCKLYQPSHQRFYVVAVELFCDTAGLPRPGARDDVEVRFVVRRLRTTVEHPGDGDHDLKDLARAAAKDLFSHAFPDPAAGTDSYPPNDPTADAARDIASLYRLGAKDAAKLAEFERKHGALLAKLGIGQQLEGWYQAAGRTGDWAKVPLEEGDPVPDAPEQEYPMWRLPASAAPCDAARTRSLWFGVVPTYSAELDGGGRPKLDDSSTYVVQCIARRRQPSPRQDCPPVVTISERTVPFRLAAFFDPAGTANRRIHVRLPDFAALAGRAGEDKPPAGVEFERPAGSQLPPVPLGTIPKPGSGGSPGGDTAEICSFSIELITIVAMFVFSLFLPIVVFAFQLWWLLLLKFCWPPSVKVDALIKALATLPLTGVSGDAEAGLREVLGIADDQRAALFEPDAKDVKSSAPQPGAQSLGQQFVADLQPQAPPEAATLDPLPPVTDPLCATPPAPGAPR